MLGLLDWGIGGIGVYREIRALMPNVDIVYLSDSGSIPYGKLPVAALTARVEKATRMLSSKGATHIILACNAASTILPRLICDLPVEGMIRHGVQAAKNTSGTLGIIGGVRTIRSQVYRKSLEQSNRLIIQRIAQPLSAYIEAGDVHSIEFQEDLIKICKPFYQVYSLLLACTHYPAVSSQISQLLPHVNLIDPASYLAQWVYKNWPEIHQGNRKTLAMTTGNMGMMDKSSFHAFGVKLDYINQIEL